MKWLANFGRFLLWVLEEFDRAMETGKEGLGLLGTTKPGTNRATD
jgi:hypothetical protein